MPAPPKRKILFVAEAVTLAHVARPYHLAQSLDPSRYGIYFASAPRYRNLIDASRFELTDIESIPETQFLSALAHGKPLHDYPTLRRYVDADLYLLSRIQPDLVVGDLRHSLAVSARLARVPYATIVNAYWSPYAHPDYVVPEIPIVRVLGVKLANAAFQLVRPLAFASHTAPMNKLQREFTLPPIGRNLSAMYCDADYALYPDVPELIYTEPLPGTHHFLGPILWSPEVSKPAWWHQLPSDRPLVYVTLGSSGSPATMNAVLRALGDEPITLMLASVKANIENLPSNVFAAPYLPGVEAAARSQLVICNGGSPTTQQALAAGVPVLGIASNMDQHVNMSFVAKSGAGEWMRTEQATPDRIRDAARRLLNAGPVRAAAQRIQSAFAAKSAQARFAQFVDEVLPPNA